MLLTKWLNNNWFKADLVREPKSFKSAQKTAFEEKGRQYTTGKVIQRLLNIDLYEIPANSALPVTKAHSIG